LAAIPVFRLVYHADVGRPWLAFIDMRRSIVSMTRFVSVDRPSPRVAAVYLFWISVVVGCLDFSFWAGEKLVLLQHFGAARVAREHLTVVSYKPELKASNGDVLPGLGFYHFVISAVMWLALSVIVLLIGMMLMPREYRQKLQHADLARDNPGCLALIGMLAVFLGFAHVPFLRNAIACAAIASAAFVFIWMRHWMMAGVRDESAELVD
jgi:hypothetical protein